jgi:hypothetical protein
VRNDFLLCIDADGDGLPDDDPRLPLDERRFGSDPTRKDTDGDGLDDLGEFIADRFAGSDPRRPDTDGDGLTDDVDPYPVVAIRPTLEYRPVDRIQLHLPVRRRHTGGVDAESRDVRNTAGQADRCAGLPRLARAAREPGCQSCSGSARDRAADAGSRRAHRQHG